MAHGRSRIENFNDEDEVVEQHQREYQNLSDGLEMIPTFLKIKKIAFLRHSDFIHLLNDFNETLETFTRDESYYLRFTIVPRSDSNILWKAFIRITCSRISRIDQSISNEVVLNLPQFFSVHRSLCQQILTLQKCSPATLHNSSTSNQNSSSFSTTKLSFTVPDDNECCICLDHQSNLVLPCTHKFCDECFCRWSSRTSSQTCPLCREDINSDSGFLLAETPTYDNVKKILVKSILSLPDDYKTRTNDRVAMTSSDV